MFLASNILQQLPVGLKRSRLPAAGKSVQVRVCILESYIFTEVMGKFVLHHFRAIRSCSLFLLQQNMCT
jgi:hypothetical protein